MSTQNQPAAAVRVSDGKRGRVFTWDWRAQPDLDAIAQVVFEISLTGPVIMRELDTGSDSYAWVIANYSMTDEEAFELEATTSA